MKTRRTLILPIISAIALTFAIYHVALTHEEPITLEPPVRPARSPYAQTIAGAGIVEPRSENIRVGTFVAGVVTEVAVKVGDRVKQGDVLFRIDDRDIRAEVNVRRAQLALAESQLTRMRALPRPEDVPVSEATVRKAEADLVGRKDMLDRSEVLVARKAATKEEFTQRQQAHAWGIAELARVTAEDNRLKAGAWKEDLLVNEVQVAQARQQLAQAEVDLDRLVVRAPLDATILKVDVRPGEYVGTPPNQTLMMLGDIDVLHVRVDIDEHDLPRFRTGLAGIGFLRGDATTPVKLEFVRLERLAEPKKSLTGAGNERVDTRVLQAIYRLTDTQSPVYVGQQLDVFLDSEPSGSTTTSMANASL